MLFQLASDKICKQHQQGWQHESVLTVMKQVNDEEKLKDTSLES